MSLIRISRDALKKYYSRRDACMVLGCLMADPSLVKSKQYPICAEFFAVRNHRLLYEAIEALAYAGLKEIGLGDIESWMYSNAQVTHHRFFEEGDESEWILDLIELANLANYSYHFDIVRKYAFLRDKLEAGQDVSAILDETEINTAILEEQRNTFFNTPLAEIIRYFDNVNMQTKMKYSIRGGENSRKSGDNADELYERMKSSPSYGWSTESRYLDTISRGCRRGMFVVESKDSGTGKSRLGVLQLCLLSCPTLWNHKTKQFEPNPYGATVPTLYIGTEMDLEEEIEPIIWATISGVDEEKIKTQTLSPEEEQRVLRAIEISKESLIFLENEPNYNVQFFWNIIEQHVTNNNIGAVIVDYIEMTPNLTSEYVQMTRGMNVREDQVLFNLSTELKNTAKSLDVFIKAYTQVSEDARRDFRIRDSGAIKGCKSLQMRADLASTTFRVAEKELVLLEKVIESVTGGLQPNMCTSVYKNRGGKIVMVKIWSIQDLGTMRVIDLFVTDWNYKLLKIKKTYLKHNAELENQLLAEETPRPVQEVEKVAPMIVDEATGEILDYEEEVEEKPKRLRKRRNKEE